MMGYGMGMGGLGLIVMFLFWLVVIGLGIWLLSALFPKATNAPAGRTGGQPGDPAELPLTILKRRYARGELSKAEYEEMRRDLEL